jgi:integrase
MGNKGESMPIYKREDIYWFSYNINGRRIRKSTGTRNKKEAEKIAEVMESKARLDHALDRPQTRTFEEVMEQFLSYSKENKRSYNKDVERANTLKTYFKKCTVNELKREDIRSYIAKRQKSVSNSTINRELSLFSAAINYCNNQLEWQLPNKITGQKLKEPSGRVRWITREEAKQLIAAAEQSKADYLTDFIKLGLNTGMRVNEILSLTWDNVDLKNKLIVLEETKSGKRESIPLNQSAYTLLVNRKQQNATRYVFSNKQGERIGSVKKAFKTACVAAGINNFRMHDMRHTCAAWLVTKGVPLIVVRDLLRHSNIKTTEIYAHLAPETVRNGVNQLDTI